MTPPATDSSNRRILLIDDNEAIHADIRKILAPAASDGSIEALEAALFGTKGEASARTFELDSALQGREGVDKAATAVTQGRPYAVAFVDMRMPPGWDGLETIERLWEKDPDIQVVICSAHSDYSRDQIVERLGATHRLLILKKPFDPAEISQLASALTEKWNQTKRANLRLTELEAIVENRVIELRTTNEELRSVVAAQKESERALRQSEERYALAAAGSHDGLWDWNLSTNEVYFSARWKKIIGYDENELGSTHEVWLNRVHVHDAHALRMALSAHLTGTTPLLENEHRIQHKDGSYRWALCRGIAVSDERSRSVRIAGSLTDITARKQTEEELRRGAFFDRLTGLPNRTLFKDTLQRVIERPRGADETFAVLFLDLDRFKIINDSLGHQAGDQLLIGIAGRLTATGSDEGTARRSSHTTIARLGGDEFVVLLEGITDLRDAELEARRILERLAPSFNLMGSDVFCSGSIGIAMNAPGYRTADEIIRDADSAMYHAKGAGKSQFATFDRTMHEKAVERLSLETDLRHALERNEFYLEYQPVVTLETGAATCFEALVRWKHPERGSVGPEVFIPIAEDTGLIISLGRWVFQEACRQLRHWRESISGIENLVVNVNLSPKQFVHTGLVDEVCKALADSDLPPSCLTLEITETAVMDDLDTSLAVLNRLRAMGVGIAMDDFGTGYSSLSCLKQLPITALKIDRTFVGQMGFSISNPAIVHAIVTLARNLRMKVIAEGVENADQVATFLALECDMAQGYYFSRPLSAEAVLKWLSGRVKLAA
ncbi:MAG: EAL domain-containing protein [Phycisphaerales bacterium]